MVINSFSTENFSFIDFKEMNEATSRKVWECRNLPEIRKWMVNQEPIPYDSHLKFVDSLKRRSDSFYYCVFKDGEFIGSVNIHIEDEGRVERGIYIHPDFWGNKYAKLICSEFYSYIRKNMEITCVTTKVLKQNIGSNLLERSLDATRVAEDEEFYYYRKTLLPS